jgi:hypothetical protein
MNNMSEGYRLNMNSAEYLHQFGPTQIGYCQKADFLPCLRFWHARPSTSYKQVWQHANPDAEIQLTVLQGAEIKTITLKPAGI